MPTSPVTRRHRAISLNQAASESPTLATLMTLTQDSKERLRSILPLVPHALRSCLEAGPVEGSSWCVLVRNNAAASKLRYLLPGMAAHLRVKGWDVQHIRLKVHNTSEREWR